MTDRADRLTGMSELPPVRATAPDAPATELPRRIDAVDVVVFLCELFAFGTLAFWGFTSWPLPWNIVFGLGAPLVAIVLWALFVSPKAVFPVHPFVHALVELLVFASATAAWWAAGQAWIGLAFAVVAVAAGLVSGLRRLN